jgi:hypothetical protein
LGATNDGSGGAVLMGSLGNKLRSLISFSACSLGKEAVEDRWRWLLGEVADKKGKVRRSNTKEGEGWQNDDDAIVFYEIIYSALAPDFIVIVCQQTCLIRQGFREKGGVEKLSNIAECWERKTQNKIRKNKSLMGCLVLFYFILFFKKKMWICVFK